MKLNKELNANLFVSWLAFPQFKLNFPVPLIDDRLGKELAWFCSDSVIIFLCFLFWLNYVFVRFNTLVDF
jgi:hypothetical protein